MRKVLLLCIGILGTLSLSAQEVYSSFGLDERDSKAVKEIRYRMAQIRKQRPTVALVLSGGGAKGAATCGVLKYLEEMDIPVDMVVGTSVGGLLGGLYSLGYDAEYLDTLIHNINWDLALSDKVEQKYLPYSRLRYKEKYLLSFPFYYRQGDYEKYLAGDAPFAQGRDRELHLGTAKNKTKQSVSELASGNLMGSLPSGFVFGQNVNQIISSRTVGYSDSTDFFKNPIPFACVATDVASGRAKIWHNGSINLAMRSTMSIPGLFAPVRTGGMVLVDGGMRNNFPVNIAREMGADIVIGINLANESLSANEIQNLADVLSASIDLMSNDIYDQNVKNVDISIHPDVTGYNMLSFNSQAIDTMFIKGYKAAQLAEKELKALRLRTGGRKAKTVRKAVDIGQQDVVIGEILVEGVDEMEADYIKDKMNVKPGMKAGRKEIEDDVARIFGRGSYDYVNYELRGAAEPYKLRIYCKKGPVHQLGLSARIDSEDLVSVLLNVGFNTKATSGHSLDLTAKVGASPSFDMVYSYSAPRIAAINARAFFRYADTNRFLFGDSRFSISYFNALQEVYLSNIQLSFLDVKLGARNQYFKVGEVIGGSSIEGDYSTKAEARDYAGIFMNARVETMDNIYFPKRGISAGFSVDALTRLGNSSIVTEDKSWLHILAADGKFPVTKGKVTFEPSFATRFVFGNKIPLYYSNIMGGDLPGRYVEQQIPFVGISNAAYMRNHLGIARIDMRYEVAPDHNIILMGNAAYNFDSFKALGEGQFVWGIGAGYGYNSILGPIKAQVYWSNFTKKVGAYLSVGYNF